MNRDTVLHKIRTALGRAAGQAPPPAPPVMLAIPSMDVETRVASFTRCLEALAGKVVHVTNSAAAEDWLRSFLDGKTAVASNAPYLNECGVAAIPGVQSGITQRDSLRAACAASDVGVSSVDYALAETGSFVMIASPREARLVSLLPPVHVAIFHKSRILTGLDELFTILPKPADQTSSMVLITGPSRTADIEQMLVRGVHGPREVLAVIVDE